MFPRALIMGALAVALAAPAQAQIEVAIMGGYTSSEGISGDTILVAGEPFNTIDVKSRPAFSLSFGYLARNGGEFGFIWGRQMGELAISGPGTAFTLGDMNIDNYQGYFGYNFGEFDAKVRPYVMIGFGATNYSSVDYNTPLRTGSTSGETQFSTTWGAGVKLYANPNVGFKAGVRWTPTYITSEAEGWWCDPWWGCYVVGDSKYAHQFEISGGVTFKFGGN